MPNFGLCQLWANLADIWPNVTEIGYTTHIHIRRRELDKSRVLNLAPRSNDTLRDREHQNEIRQKRPFCQVDIDTCFWARALPARLSCACCALVAVMVMASTMRSSDLRAMGKEIASSV